MTKKKKWHLKPFTCPLDTLPTSFFERVFSLAMDLLRIVIRFYRPLKTNTHQESRCNDWWGFKIQWQHQSCNKSSFWHLKNIAKMRNFVSSQDLEKIIHAFISCRVDYCNALLPPRRESTFLQFLNPCTGFQLNIELISRPYLLSINHSVVWAQNISQICLLSTSQGGLSDLQGLVSKWCPKFKPKVVKWLLAIMLPAAGTSSPWNPPPPLPLISAFLVY